MSNVKIAIQYSIQNKNLNIYKELINDIYKIMIELGAENFSSQQYSISKNNSLCVETFCFPNEAHFHALKEIRNSSTHSTFKKLNLLIGEQQVYYVALKYESSSIKHPSYSMQHITV